MELERIATDSYDFEYVRTGGFTYVDKTALIYHLANGSIGKQFFLSRPRRFGKSLLCSTIQKLFEGRRDLFEGLAVDSLPWDWFKTYPVLRLDMSLCSGDTSTRSRYLWNRLFAVRRRGLALLCAMGATCATVLPRLSKILRPASPMASSSF